MLLVSPSFDVFWVRHLTVRAATSNGLRSFSDMRPPVPYKMPSDAPSKIVPLVASMIASVARPILASILGTSLFDTNRDSAELQVVRRRTGRAIDFDFDGDEKADVGRWNASATDFRVRKSNDGSSAIYSLGSATSKAAPGDFDGDGKFDAAVFVDGTWTYKTSPGASAATISLGQSGDLPVAGHFDGDDVTDAAVFRPSNSTWYIKQSTTSNTVSAGFGTTGDVPVQGDYDGDGQADLAIFRPSTGYWWIQGSTAGTFSVAWGLSTDIPVPADFDGDGKTDPTVFRPSNGAWYVLESDGGYTSYDIQVWGSYADQPAPADFDGDGKADPAVWRPATGIWHIKKSGSSGSESYAIGIPGDTAVPSAYIKQVGVNLPTVGLAKERIAPRNATGGTNLYSQNFGWAASLVGLAGRGGLDMGLGISYNSLIWTKVDDTIYFDTNQDNISPGFRFGLPVIEQGYFVPGGISTDPYWTYIMVTPSGGRTEFRQVGVSEVFETADSSYLQLVASVEPDPNEPAEDLELTLRGTDGTQMKFAWLGGAYRCTEIKDRNGNYITVEYTEAGLLETITDTLGREVIVNYDQELYPISITQTWKTDNGSGSNVTHKWAEFSYSTVEIDTDFEELTVAGPPNEWEMKVLDKIEYPDESYTKFHYNGYAQVWKVENFAANDDLLNAVRSDLESPATDLTDVPRFTTTWSKAANFNTDGYGVPLETQVTSTISFDESYSLPGSLTGDATLIEVEMAGHPYDAVSKIYVGESGWREGLTLATEDHAAPVEGGTVALQRWSWTNWTQDDEGSDEVLNPRVVETRVGDGTSTRKTQIDHLKVGETDVSLFGLIDEVRVYDSDLTTVLKKQQTDYDLDSAYTSRRIIGLPAETRVYGYEVSSLNLMSKVTYEYDEGDFSDTGLGQDISPVQHDSANYDDEFIVGRGNLTSMTRWSVEYPTTSGEAVTSSLKYNTAGSVVARTTPWDGTNTRTIKIGYADNWNSTGNPTTYAYPTSLTDPANTASTVKYRYDIGANVEAASPAPAGQTYGKTTKRVFDAVGRLQKHSVYVNTAEQAYTRYEYPANGVQSKVYRTLVDTNANGPDGADEVLSESWADGAGRTRRSRVPHTFDGGGDTETWAGTITEYDILGRVARQSVPTEVDGSWEPDGDDTAFLWTHQKYDWMGRVIRKIATDGADSPTLNDSDVLISYAGCGCAGGMVTTVEGERVPIPGTENFARRKQKVYQDILGRTWKTEAYEWDGTTVYATAVNTFNGKDQVTRTREFAGSASSETFQDTTATFDGHGRLKTSHRPEQRSGETLKYTTYNYNPDDSILNITDGRGVVTNYIYNSRGLVEEMTWEVGETGVTDAHDVEFGYDALGNRTSMTDGLGTVAYEYDPLSRMTAETRDFTDTLANAPNGVFRLEYTYTQGGQLKSLKDPYGEQINYAHDKLSRLSTVTGSSFGGVTSYASSPHYRAWGGLRGVEYGNGMQMAVEYNNRLQPESFLVNETGEPSNKLFDRSYEYYADGRLKLADEDSNAYSQRFDRLFTYDQMGRVKDAKSGIEAHGQTQTEPIFLPYRQSYYHNAFGNVTGRDSTLWDYTEGDWDFSYTVTNNRVAGYGYDADGRQVSGDGIAFEYDSTGGMIETGRAMSYETEMFRDGAGREAKRSNRVWDGEEDEWGEWKTTYSLYSSVLGRVVSEAVETGAKRRTFVVAGGQEIARQAYSEESEQVVGFVHRDASGLSGRSTNAGTGTASSTYASVAEEFDALGNNVGTRGHLSRPPHEGGSMPTSNDTITFDDMTLGQCSIDGVIALCSMMDRMGDALSAGALYYSPTAGFRYFQFDGSYDRLSGVFRVFIPDQIQTATSSRVVPDDAPLPEHPPPFVPTGSWENRLAGFLVDNQFKFNLIHMPSEAALVERIKAVVFDPKALGEECTRAFEAAGATPIREQLAQHNLRFITESVFMDPQQDKHWVPDQALVDGMRDEADRKIRKYPLIGRAITGVIEAGDIAFQENGGVYKGNRYIGLTYWGTKETIEHFSVTLIHALLHSGGVPGKSGGTTDLHYLGDKYDSVIDACQKNKPRVTRLGGK